MHQALLTLILLLLARLSDSATAPQLCATFTSNTCRSCYPDFWSSSSPSPLNAGSTCGCPPGFYLHSTLMCYFCPTPCRTCSSVTVCSTCLDAYQLVNGSCVKPASLPETGIMEFKTQLDNAGMAALDIYGFYIKYAISTSASNYFTNCSGMASQPFYGPGIFDWDSEVVRVFKGLPRHQYVQIKLNYLIQDQWEGEGFILEIEQGSNPDPEAFTSVFFSETKYFDSRLRRRQICGLPSYFDNLGVFTVNLPHSSSILKMRMRTSLSTQDSSNLDPHYNNIYFGIRDLVLLFGDCPKHCTFCASAILCGACSPPYVLQSGQCVCDTAYAVLTTNGNCIHCQGGEVVMGDRCVQCQVAIPYCTQCASDGTCVQCMDGRFLLNQDLLDLDGGDQACRQ